MIKLSDPKAAADEVRRHVDIIKVVSEELGPAPKTGTQDFFWCCPFHHEKTPSFGVHIATQIFKCFGCGLGGNVIAFIQQFHGMNFVEATINLARRFGVSLAAYERAPTAEEVQEQRYLEVMDKAAAFCSNALFANKAVLNWYLGDTQFTMEQLVDYDVGYSHSSDTLIQYLYQAIPNLTQLEVDQLEFSSRLMWNNSIVYPVKDTASHTRRFHNKPLSPPSDWSGKYAGTSSKHPLFSHGLLFGLHMLKKDLKNTNFSIRLVEGQKGAIAARGAAILGSSIHEEQIKTLQENQVKEMRVCFDGDEAGRAASLRLLDQIQLMTHMHLLVARLPNDQQPDDIYKTGKANLDQIFADAMLPVQFYLDMRRGADGSFNVQDKFTVIQDLRGFLTALPELHLNLTANFLAKELEVESDSIRTFIGDLKLTKSGLVNRETELAVIRHLLLEPRSFATARQAIVDLKTFTIEGYRYLFGAMDAAHKKARTASGADSVTIQVVRDQIAVMFPHFKELPGLVDSVLATEPKYEFMDALQRTVDLYRRRMGIEQSKFIAANLQDQGQSTNELLSKFRRQLVSSLEVRKDDIATPIDLAERTSEELQLRMSRKTSVVGYDFSKITDVDGQIISCLPALTLAVSGLQTEHQLIISANTGVGKSFLALQMVVAVSVCPPYQDQVPWLWVALEMSEVELCFRILSMLTGINSDLIISGQLNAEQYMRVQKAIDMVARSQLYIRKPRTGNSDEIFALVEEFKFRHGIKGVTTDYAQLVTPNQEERRLGRDQVWGNFSKMMKNQVASTMKMVSILIAQLNRKDFKEGEVKGTENVGGSYEISQDADEFLSLGRKTEIQMNEERQLRGNRFALLSKRRGGTSGTVIDLELDEAIKKDGRFMERVPVEQMIAMTKGVL